MKLALPIYQPAEEGSGGAECPLNAFGRRFSMIEAYCCGRLACSIAI